MYIRIEWDYSTLLLGRTGMLSGLELLVQGSPPFLDVVETG